MTVHQKRSARDLTDDEIIGILSLEGWVLYSVDGWRAVVITNGAEYIYWSRVSAYTARRCEPVPWHITPLAWGEITRYALVALFEQTT
jgi:hypothetical protein